MLPGRGPGSRPGDTWAGRLARPPREGWQFAIRRPSPRSHASHAQSPPARPRTWAAWPEEGDECI